MIKGKQNFVKSQPAIYDIGTEILFLPCFATTDMFLFCKKLIFSGIATHWPVDKDSGGKTPFWAIIKKTQKFVKAVSAQIGSIFLKPDLVNISRPRFNQLFSHLTNSKFRASLSGVSSDTPSSWKLQFIFQKHDLLQKTENLHAALDWEVGNLSRKTQNNVLS